MERHEREAPHRSSSSSRRGGGLRLGLRLFTKGHALLYALTGGRVGEKLGGAPVLLLTTRGRKTGKQRTTPLLYITDGDRFIVAASNGGLDQHPSWWWNLQADPDSRVRVGGQTIRVRAQQGGAEERTRLWSLFVGMWPRYGQYQQRTAREIPVIILHPV